MGLGNVGTSGSRAFSRDVLSVEITGPDRPQSFQIRATATNILLLGDIGLVKDNGLFTFFRRTLELNRGVRIFYILGNHEPYQITLEEAIQKLRIFEQEARSEFGGRFKFLHRDRYDVTSDITILGCTLWTAVQPHQAVELGTRLTDLNEERGIRDWSLEKAREEHVRDLTWLNTQVQAIQSQEPHRQIIIATHHCPTIDSRASDPKHHGSSISSAFASDLSSAPCWTSLAVKVWMYGHTHYSCKFEDEHTGKLVISNQKGYMSLGGVVSKAKRWADKVVEVKNGVWRVKDDTSTTVDKEEFVAESMPKTYTQSAIAQDQRREVEIRDGQQHSASFLKRSSNKVKALLRQSPPGNT